MSYFKKAVLALVMAFSISYGFKLVERKLFYYSKASYSYLKNESFYSKAELAKILGKRILPKTGSEKIRLPSLESSQITQEATVEYSIDQGLQNQIAQLFKHGRTPYGAFVAIDAKTGQVLSMVSHSIYKKVQSENLTLRSTFPAASVFKVVTAAAALEKGALSHKSLIPVRGGFHTLFRHNVINGGGLSVSDEPPKKQRFFRLISFEDALAKSVNSVFGKVGIFGVGAEPLRETSAKFYFEKNIPLELEVDLSQAHIPDDEFGIAESASGYTKMNTLSPVHGAMIAASVVNGGVMPEPSVVSKITDASGNVLYEFKPQVLAQVIDEKTADELSTMMRKTVTDGTSKWSFQGMSRSLSLSGVVVGGKTGTLTGDSPPGRYDWFIGFGSKGNRKIAFASLCIHSSRYGIKASQIARAALETLFNPLMANSRFEHRNSKNNGDI